MIKRENYQDRFYRRWPNSRDLIVQELIVGETDILISSEKDIKEKALEVIKKYRGEIEGYIEINPSFSTSLKSLDLDQEAPGIVKEMMRASRLAGVGPMASVAGAVAEFVGKGLLGCSGQLIVENGGDIFISSDIKRTVAIFAGKSPLTNKLFIEISPSSGPLGICTSSGTVGHSLSFGKADACVIISESASLADAVATSACNKVTRKEDIQPALEYSLSVDGVRGALIVLGSDFGVCGDIELIGG